MAVNLDGVFHVVQEGARRMAAAEGGTILMTASTNGVVGHPFYADYNASKAGVILLARSMALELAPAIRVNAICPGYVMTPMQQAEYTPEMLARDRREDPPRPARPARRGRRAVRLPRLRRGRLHHRRDPPDRRRRARRRAREPRLEPTPRRAPHRRRRRDRQARAARSAPVHPYIPNAVPEVRAAMLATIGAADVEELYEEIPERLRLRRPLDLPPPLRSEAELVRHVDGLLGRNRSTRELVSFLGAGLLRAPRARGLRRDQRPRRVPHCLRRRALRGPRPLPGALRVLLDDGRAARDGRRQRPDVRRLPGDRHRAADGRPGDRPLPPPRDRLDRPRQAARRSSTTRRPTWRSSSSRSTR